MYKKHIEQLMTISLKFFFDMDYALFHHFFFTAIVIAGLVKLFFSRIILELRDGIQTVKTDIEDARISARIWADEWKNSETRERLASYADMVRSHFTSLLPGK